MSAFSIDNPILNDLCFLTTYSLKITLKTHYGEKCAIPLNIFGRDLCILGRQQVFFLIIQKCYT